METLKHDKAYIDSIIYEKDGTYYCKEPCSIEFPAWYMDRNLGEFGEYVTYYGVFIIVCNDKYAVSLIPTLCRSNPINITSVERKDGSYTKLEFGKDDPILVEANTIKSTLVTYDYFKNFIIKANIPWFLTPEHVNKIQRNLVPYAGSGVGANPITNELIVSVITRSDNDPDLYYRQTNMKGPYRYVPLTDPFYSIKSTVNRIAGSYMQDGIVSALVKKPTMEEASDIEKHLTE